MITPPARFSRGQYRMVLALLALILAAQAQSATASIAWCKTDPEIFMGDKKAHVWVLGTVDVYPATSTPVQVVVTVPVGVATRIGAMDTGFGEGYAVTFQESSKLKGTNNTFEFLVQIYVPASVDLLPIKLEVTNAAGSVVASKQGTSNGWITQQAKV